MTPEVFAESDAELGEGPVVDARGVLSWVDLLRGAVFESRGAGETALVATIPTAVGAVAPRAQAPGLAVAVEAGFGLLVDGGLEVRDAVLAPGTRMNDAKVDSRGRLWAGSMMQTPEPGTGRLHRWDGEAPSTVVRGGLTLPNGIGWSPADDRMYLIDSLAHALLVADYDADDGEPGPFTELARFEGGLPDGLAVDDDGGIWVAVWGAAEVRRLTPDGRVDAVIRMPVSQPTSCAFGPDGTLYVTSARIGLAAPALAREPLAGSVFACATARRGVPVPAFRG